MKCTAVSVLLFCAVPTLGQLRIVTLNASNAGSATAGPRAGMETILTAIGTKVSDDPLLAGDSGIAKPIDILCLQEVNSASATGAGYAALFNQIYNTNNYAFGTLNGSTTGAGTQGIIYNTAAVELISSAAVGTTSLTSLARQNLRYQLRPVGYGAAADVYIYNGHWKAGTSDQARRLAEANAIRTDVNSNLSAGANVIYTGDLNVYRSSDLGYARLLDSGNGQAFDPINAPGDWSGGTGFKAIHTQSPYRQSLNPGFGGTGGGMDDRFDQQLVTANLNDAEGVAYIPNSYFVLGNNGSHALNQPLDSGTGASGPVLNELSSILDHLPVVADYQVPAKMAVSHTQPSVVLSGAPVGLAISVQNIAPTQYANGADELDYTVNITGAAAGSFSGSASPAAPANMHLRSVDVSIPGIKSGSYTVNASSQATADGSFASSYQIAVLDHAWPSFAMNADIASLSIDFGIWPRAGEVAVIEPPISVYNRAPAGSSDLIRDAILNLGEAFSFKESLTTIAAGESGQITAYFTPLDGAYGLNSRTVTLVYGDINAPNRQTYSLSVMLSSFVGYAGDANLDLNVTLADFTTLAANFGLMDARWQDGDFNRDGMVVLSDFTSLAANFGTSAPANRTSVPEPSASTLLIMIFCVVQVRHRTAGTSGRIDGHAPVRRVAHARFPAAGSIYIPNRRLTSSVGESKSASSATEGDTIRPHAAGTPLQLLLHNPPCLYQTTAAGDYCAITFTLG